VKKSQLRNIIRESIKELVSGKKLIKEQATQIPNAMQVSTLNCGPGNTHNYSTIMSLTINGQAPQAGDIFTADFCNMGGTNIGTYFVREVLGPGDVTAQPNIGDNGHVYGTGAQGTFDPADDSFCPNCIPGFMYNSGTGGSSGIPSYYLPPGGCQDAPGGYDANIIANGCNPGGVPLPVLGCTDPNSAGCDPLATQDDGSCVSAFVNDISGFLNDFGCHDPSADNYVPYQGAGGVIGSMFNSSPNSAGWIGTGCNVYPMMTTNCGTQMVDLNDMFATTTATQMVDTSCCDYGYSCSASIGIGQQFACLPGNAQNPGLYPTLAACNASNLNMPNSCGGGAILQPKKAPDDKFGSLDIEPMEPMEPREPMGDEDKQIIKRMQNLAKISKK